jgi:SAM-dependent methyltransferase
MSSIFDYPFPLINDIAPVWNGQNFLLGKQKIDFLRYNCSESGWSTYLTEMHEKEAGDGNHPIDLLSRHYAHASIEQVIARQGIVLDVGCSSGFFLREVRNRHPKGNLIGADYLLDVVSSCVSRLPGVPMLQFDLCSCPLPDNSLDGVVALNVLEHIDMEETALANIFRVLKPGGVAHIEVPAGKGLYDFYDEVLMHHRRYGRVELIQKCKKAGFHLRRAFGIGWTLYPIFYAAKKRNRVLGKRLSVAEKKSLVANAIQKTGVSRIIKSLLRFESAIGRRLTFPFGIRHCVVLKKP